MSSSTLSPYQAFAKTFASYHSQYSDPGPSSHQLDAPIRLDAVLDQKAGLLTTLQASLEQAIRARSVLSTGSWDTAGGDQMTVEEHEALLLEHRTWQLLRAVYSNRLHRADSSFAPPSAEKTLAGNPYIPPEDLTRLIVDEDEELSLWAALVEHLQSRPLLNQPPPLEARHGYLPSTARRTKAARLTASASVSTSTLASLDPDFTLRDPHGQGLAGEDATYQLPLLQTLFDLVRHGEMDAAIRATLSQPERSLYAALTSDLSTLLPACQTWEDHLWAQLSARIEARTEARQRELGGFWEEDGRGLGQYDASEVGGGLDEVFGAIAGVQSSAVTSATRNPYYVAQKMIILGRTDSLISEFADRIAGLEDSVSPELIGPLVRFFAHFILVLRILGQAVPDAAANSIIQAYLGVLEREGNDQLVAMYAACLREGNGEESYARFLRTMDPNASKATRIEALNRAKQYHLDVAVIARQTVRLALEEAFASLPALSRQQPDITSFATGLSERDVQLIRTLEWLTLTSETMPDALVQSNAVARYFLALGQAHAAQALLKTMPSGIASAQNEEDDPEENVTEHEDFRALFAVFASYEAVEEVASRAPKATATKLEQHNYRKSLSTAIERTNAATVNLLTSDWLRYRIPSAAPSASQRRKELRRIRQLFIPTLALRLHSLLMEHQTTFPYLLDAAMDLVKVVAREENHVYEEFLGSTASGSGFADGAGKGAWRLEVYLERVREMGLRNLQIGGSAFGQSTRA